MLPAIALGFREFFEAFLIVSVFLSVSKKLGLKRELEIGLAALSGFALSFALIAASFFLGQEVRAVLNERSAELLEGAFMAFAGLFIAYAAFSLHDLLGAKHRERVKSAAGKLEAGVFDLSLFVVIVLLIVREGFEVAVLGLSVSLLSDFGTSMLGMGIGFLGAAVIGAAAYATLLKLHIEKIFKVASYAIVAVGAWFTQAGLEKLFAYGLGIDFRAIAPLPFIPVSLVGAIILCAYGAAVYFLFLRTKGKAVPN
jgi:high-affinity Fe2+/Pb2+ permease